jgi:HipA-like protein
VTWRPTISTDLFSYRARRLLRADRRGSSWPVLIDTDAGVFYTKLRGAAQAPASLVAELIVGALADELDLRVPTRVLIEIPDRLPTDDANDELAQLLQASIGRSLGFQYLADAAGFRPGDAARVEPSVASSVVWLDGLVMNPDRTAANPNLLWSHRTLWLIDHGACLGFQHDWPLVTEATPRRPWDHSGHVLAPRANLLAEVDPALTSRLDRAALEAAVAAVPEEYLRAVDQTVRRARAAYVAFLWKRLKPPRPFLLNA